MFPTTAALMFPPPDSSPATSSSVLDAATPAAAKKILILDDNFNILLLYHTLVSEMGLSVRTTADGNEALRWLADEPFDLILTDLRMPVMGGAEFIRRARALGVKSRIIAITAFQNLADANQLSKFQVYAILIKPVLLTKLEEIIRRALTEPEEA